MNKPKSHSNSKRSSLLNSPRIIVDEIDFNNKLRNKKENLSQKSNDTIKEEEENGDKIE